MWWFLRETKTWHCCCISDLDWVTFRIQTISFCYTNLIAMRSNIVFYTRAQHQPSTIWVNIFPMTEDGPLQLHATSTKQTSSRCANNLLWPRGPPPPDLSQTKDSISGSSSSSPGSEALSRWYDIRRQWWTQMILSGSSEQWTPSRRVRRSAPLRSCLNLFSAWLMINDHSDNVWSSPKHIS